MHTCEICGFQTGRLANFVRHMDRKTPCKPVENVTEFEQNVTEFEQNVTEFEQNVTEFEQNVTEFEQNVTVPKGHFCHMSDILQQQAGKVPTQVERNLRATAHNMWTRCPVPGAIPRYARRRRCRRARLHDVSVLREGFLSPR